MNEKQLIISKLLHDIISNENEKVEDYYGVVVSVYINIDKYIEQLDDVNDKIYLAQWCNNFAKVHELINIISLTDYQKSKYLLLKNKNSEIDETINFKILDKKYDFLDNILDMLTTDIDIQDQILSLSDNRLKLFEKMYLKLEQLTDYCNPYLSSILRRISYVSFDTSWKNKFHQYDSLLFDIDNAISNGYELSDKEIEILLYLFVSPIQHNVPNLNEMQRFGEEDTLDVIMIKNGVKKAKEENDIETLKSYILNIAYGIGLSEAQKICKMFNIKDIEITLENKEVFRMYLAIYQIINEKDPFILGKLYEKFLQMMKFRNNFKKIIVFESDLKKAFAHDLNKQVYKIETDDYLLVDGVKVYDAGIDFKMIVTVVGAYQGNFVDQENYSDYWNSSKIRSHGNCCSLIGNTNLSMAGVKNIILGFSTMSDNMLLLSGISDINTTPNSKKFNITIGKSEQKYMSADSLLDNTRGDYNELVYERRDLSDNPQFYKKNPDYVVFIEEYENYDYWFKKYKDNHRKLEFLKLQKEKEDRQWRETLKAAHNFSIPIVKINRERVAKSESSKIKLLLEQFKETLNPELLSIIITLFENSRIGNSGLHVPIQSNFFSIDKMNYILNEIKSTINSLENDFMREDLYFTLYKVIKNEKRKINLCKYGRSKEHQVPGIDFNKELYELEKILINSEVNHSSIVRYKK